MIHTHQRAGAACTLAVEEVPADEAFRYGVVGPVADADLSADAFRLAELVEKPDKGTAPSNLAIAPRYVFDRSIFGAIDATLPGRSGELWLTDSIEILVKQGLAVQATRLRDGERRYDIGTFETYFKAFIDFALSDDRYGYMIRQYLIWKADQI